VASGSGYAPGTDGAVLVISTGPAAPGSFTLTEIPTPEPASMALIGLGLGALLLRRRRSQS